MPKTPKKRKRVYKVTLTLEDTWLDEYVVPINDIKKLIILDTYDIGGFEMKNLKIRRVKA